MLAGEVERADASVSGQLLKLLNIKKLKALETKRRWKELGEFEEGMVTLEAALEANKKGATDGEPERPSWA